MPMQIFIANEEFLDGLYKGFLKVGRFLENGLK